MEEQEKSVEIEEVKEETSNDVEKDAKKAEEEALEQDKAYDIDGKRKKAKKKTLPWYFYVLSFFASLMLFYTIFFYLFCFVF